MVAGISLLRPDLGNAPINHAVGVINFKIINFRSVRWKKTMEPVPTNIRLTYLDGFVKKITPVRLISHQNPLPCRTFTPPATPIH
jgi:hypothetical protein